VLVFWSVLSLTVLQAAAGVKIKTLPDGTKLMYNDPPRRLAYGPPRSSGTLPPLDLDELIEMHARNRELDPDLVRAVVAVESAYQVWALSVDGAMGLMQLMPETADRLAVQDPYDPDENLRGGTAYLRQLIDLFGGNLQLALAGYNAGPEAVDRYGGIPPYEETRSYVERVLRLYRDDPSFALPATGTARVGRKTHLTRGPDGRFLLTTSPAGNN
jgi:soluble lytic murein transglycosylase